MLGLLSEVTHFKTKPAVGYLLFSFSLIVVKRKTLALETETYRLSSLIEVLCFIFSGIEFHNMLDNGMKEFW